MTELFDWPSLLQAVPGLLPSWWEGSRQITLVTVQHILLFPQAPLFPRSNQYTHFGKVEENMLAKLAETVVIICVSLGRVVVM